MTNPFTQVDTSTLNAHVEFDVPFRTYGEGVRFISHENVGHAPEGLYSEDAPEGWEFVEGYSMQYGYAGPVMHPSEFLGGKMARDVLSHAGVYVVVTVTDLDDGDEPEPYGWAVLRKL